MYGALTDMAHFPRVRLCMCMCINTLTPCVHPRPRAQVALEMYGALTDIQTEKAEDKFGWVMPVN